MQKVIGAATNVLKTRFRIHPTAKHIAQIPHIIECLRNDYHKGKINGNINKHLVERFMMMVKEQQIMDGVRDMNASNQASPFFSSPSFSSLTEDSNRTSSRLKNSDMNTMLARFQQERDQQDRNTHVPSRHMPIPSASNVKATPFETDQTVTNELKNQVMKHDVSNSTYVANHSHAYTPVSIEADESSQTLQNNSAMTSKQYSDSPIYDTVQNEISTQHVYQDFDALRTELLNERKRIDDARNEMLQQREELQMQLDKKAAEINSSIDILEQRRVHLETSEVSIKERLLLSERSLKDVEDQRISLQREKDSMIQLQNEIETKEKELAQLHKTLKEEQVRFATEKAEHEMIKTQTQEQVELIMSMMKQLDIRCQMSNKKTRRTTKAQQEVILYDTAELVSQQALESFTIPLKYTGAQEIEMLAVQAYRTRYLMETTIVVADQAYNIAAGRYTLQKLIKALQNMFCSKGVVKYSYAEDNVVKSACNDDTLNDITLNDTPETDANLHTINKTIAIASYENQDDNSIVMNNDVATSPNSDTDHNNKETAQLLNTVTVRQHGRDAIYIGFDTETSMKIPASSVLRLEVISPHEYMLHIEPQYDTVEYPAFSCAIEQSNELKQLAVVMQQQCISNPVHVKPDSGKLVCRLSRTLSQHDLQFALRITTKATKRK